MYDLISLGTVSIDMYFKGESLTIKDDRFQLAVGGKYFTNHFYQHLGGGGANVAIGAQKHGLRTAVMAKIGNNSFKKLIIDNLQDERVSYQYCNFEDEYINISSILLTEDGDKTVINYQTPHQKFFRSSKDYATLLRAKAVYMGNLPDVSISEKTTVARFLQHHNIPLFLNMGVTDVRREFHQLETLLKNTDVLILNGHEFADLVKKPYDHINFQENVLANYLADFRQLLLVVTEGVNGSYGYTHSTVHHQDAYKTKIVDSTGAGDGYTAAFIAEYLYDNNLEHAMEKGALHASKILAKIGAN